MGKLAAHTPSLLIDPSLSSTTAKGVAQEKQAVSPKIKLIIIIKKYYKHYLYSYTWNHDLNMGRHGIFRYS